MLLFVFCTLYGLKSKTQTACAWHTSHTQNFADAYVRAQISKHAKTDAYWHQVGLVWTQLDGLVAGSAPHLTRLDLLLVNAIVDLSSLIHSPFENMNEEQSRLFLEQTTHCSAIVKLVWMICSPTTMCKPSSFCAVDI